MMKSSDSRNVQEEVDRGLWPDERAVSEVVSIVLLLAVAVMGVGLIAVTIYSQPMPEKTPQVDILVSEKDGVISLTHNGGDPLAEGMFYVLADGVRLDDPISPPGGAGPWSLGRVLQYDVGTAPEQVQVVYNGGGGAVLLKSATFSGTAGAGGPDIPAGPGGGEWVESELNISFDTIEERDTWVVNHFVEMLESNSLYLGQAISSSGGTTWTYSGSFKFTLNDSRTYLDLDTKPAVTRITFAESDTLEIALKDKESSMRFFAIGHGGWHISATDVQIYKNGSPLGNGGIVGGRIYDYRNFTSSVVIQTANKAVQTEFYVDSLQIINGESDHQITLTSIKPADPTLLILDISKNDPCYFVGDAEIDPATLALINASMTG